MRLPFGLMCVALVLVSAGSRGTAVFAAPERQSTGRGQTALGAGIPYSVGRALPDKAAGWTRSAEISMHGPGGLWEYIDGAAEQYLSYGFQDLATATYTPGAGGSVVVDIYRMADAVRAFGIYTEEANPGARAVAVGVEGRAGRNTLRFWSGRFYVKMTAPAAGGPPEARMLALASAIAAGLGPAGGPPSQLRWFPERGLIAHSIRYVPADALGQSMFVNAFQAKYEQAPEPSTLVIVPFTSAEIARGALARYESFLAGSGRAATRLSSPGDGGFSAREGFYGLVVALRSGSTLILSLGASSERAASALAAEAIRRIAATPGVSFDGR